MLEMSHFADNDLSLMLDLSLEKNPLIKKPIMSAMKIKQPEIVLESESCQLKRIYE